MEECSSAKEYDKTAIEEMQKSMSVS